jgi:two-component system sensor histidine kinase and response regulator WspE
MRAAHSIKGAARIVSQGEAVKVAHAIEEFFVAVQRGQARIGASDVDVLLRAVDLLTRISTGAAVADESQQLIEQLAHLGSAPSPKPSTFVLDDSSRALLPIFRAELKTHCGAVRSGLAALGEKPDARQLETLRAAFDSIGGSARLLRIAPLATFAAAAASRVVVDARGAIDPLTRAAETLLALAACDDEQFDEQLAQGLAKLPVLDALLVTGDPLPVQRATDNGQRATPDAPREAPAKKSNEVRITADRVDRLMAATGETTVAARWLEGFTSSFAQLKKQQDALIESLDVLHERLPSPQIVDIRQSAIDCRAVLMQRVAECENFSRQLDVLSGRLYREVLATRMRPFSAGAHPFPRLVRDLARELGKEVALQIDGASTEVDRDTLEKLEAPLTHLLRNAIDHGIERPAARLAAGKPSEGHVRLAASHHHGLLQIVVEDDGRGIHIERIRAEVSSRNLAGFDIVSRLTDAELLEFLFLPGFSTKTTVSEISGRGVGLDVVQAMVIDVGGVVRVQTRFGLGTTFTLQMPITRTVVRSLLVDLAGEPYAVPLARIERAIIVPRDEIQVSEGREYVAVGDANVGIIPLRQILGIENVPAGDQVSILVISNHRMRYGVVVDRFAGESDLVLRPLDPRLGKVPNLSAVSLSVDGIPILLLDIDDIVTTVDELLAGGGLQRLLARSAAQETLSNRRKRVLVVDDSLTVRELERRLLENRGYEVEVAVDGMHAWNAVRTEQFDLVISDVDMPRMNGIELVTRIKGDERLSRIPVVIVSYKDREEDRLRGLEAGANYYLTKTSFQDETMLRAVADLIGPAQS